MLGILYLCLALSRTVLAQNGPLRNTTISASIYAAARVDDIDLDVLPFVQAAPESIEVAYMANLVPLLGNASRKCGSVVRRSIRIRKKENHAESSHTEFENTHLITYFKKVMGGKKVTLILGKKRNFVLHDS